MSPARRLQKLLSSPGLDKRTKEHIRSKDCCREKWERIINSRSPPRPFVRTLRPLSTGGFVDDHVIISIDASPKSYGKKPKLSLTRLLKYNAQLIWYEDSVYRGETGMFNDQLMRHGLGVKFYSGRKFYEGFWIRNKKHGKGFEKFENGDTYIGEYVRGRPEG